MIKVWTGQVWKAKTGRRTANVIASSSGIVAYTNENGMDHSTDIHRFLSRFEFIPQNDLEWFAVNVDEWTAPSYRKYIVRVDDSDWTYIKSNTYKTHSSTRQEWQNMRYHLGLDKKPRYRLTGGEWVKQ